MARAFSFARALGSLAADVDLLVAEPRRYGHTAGVERGPEQTALHDQRAGPLIDRGAAERAHHVAPAWPSVGLDPEPQIDDSTTRPAIPHGRRIIASGDPPD